jgi:hypothetical protein
MTPVFKKTIFISVCWHLAVFNVFSFTFGTRLDKIGLAQVSFLGSFLNKADLESRIFDLTGIKKVFNRSLEAPSQDQAGKDYAAVFAERLKPQFAMPFTSQKTDFLPQPAVLAFREKRAEPVVMLYPSLPYNFLLYFKDRESVHIEVMFNIAPGANKTNTLLIKRKISSGNLEADLLSMRYIGHYLSIQQLRFPTNGWQELKIDLSAKE